MRTLIFKCVLFFGLFAILILFFPSLFLPQKIVLFGGKLFGHWSSLCLKIFFSTRIIVKGKENIITNNNFFIACSHQSMFETFFLQTIFNCPIFILKKELLKIPIFGLFLKKIDSISINRNKVTRENLDFIDKIKNTMKKTQRPLIIFPQGTRVTPDEKVPFKKGVGRIYKELNVQCQPIAVNSGKVWPKSGELKPNQTITVSILKPIDTGMNEKDFISLLEKEIYREQDSIL